MGRVVLVTGGARSGKSDIAEQLAARHERVTYIATARNQGREMGARVEKHRARRPSTWPTLEAPLDLGTALASVSPDTQSVMIECLYIWCSNRILALGDPTKDDWWPRVRALEETMMAETRTLAQTARGAPWDLVLVTSEIGLGTTPEMPRPRAFRDLVGYVNRTAAEASEKVYLVVAGIPVDLSRLRAEI